MYDARTNLSQEVLDRIKGYFKKELFKTVIRENVRIAESPSFGLPITLYSPNSYGAEDYMKLAKEVISRE
jgi:chromosome partitioning protein